MLVPIKRALLSVSDKTGIVPLAKALAAWGCELISTGGTRQLLEKEGIACTEISLVTGNPEAFGGRMKTISFNIESALLYDRERDAEEAKQLGISPIDLVVCNLYPFEQVLKQHADFETLIENIDIGGPTMLRSAAKNFKYVTVLTQPSDYAELLAELEQHQGATSYDFRRLLMTKTFNHTADYDALIAQTMDGFVGKQSLRLAFEQGQPLRYGENSHQKAKFYRQKGVELSLADFKFLHGKELSYNNILDLTSAVDALKAFDLPACAVVKHNNPCGLACADNLPLALRLAWEGDPVSAFGSVIAFNRPLDLETVQYFELGHEDKSRRKFVEVVVAPQISAEALAYLQQHKNLRVLELPVSVCQQEQDLRFVPGALLVQDSDQQLDSGLQTVGELPWDVAQDSDLIRFGLAAMRGIKSNSIVLVRRHAEGLQLLGMGAGQPNRLVATRLAIEKAKENLSRELGQEDMIRQALGKAILVSDAFFPFEDNVELAAEQGIRWIVQPGGSIRDKQVIETANRLGVAMAFSGLRHFKH